MCCCVSFAGQTIYVDANAPGSNDGTSWADAYNLLQDALTEAGSDPGVTEILVAQGIYRPDQGVGIGPGDRTATFKLKSGLAIRGGYAGFGEPDPNARDIGMYETKLSGDLNGDDPNDLDPQDLWGHPTRAENSYHVVVGSGTDQTAILDGATVIGGSATVFEDVNDSGGGMYNAFGSPTVINCKFTSNSAGNDGLGAGGGIFNVDSAPTLTDCIFMGNSAGDGCSGGGIYNWRSNPMLHNCTFSLNVAEYYGGGMCNVVSDPSLAGCAFSRNVAGVRGGGMCNKSSSLTLMHCTFNGNSSTTDGGGMYNSLSSLELTYCVFSGNVAENEGGGMYNFASDLALAQSNCSGNVASRGAALYVEGYDSMKQTSLTNCSFCGNLGLNGNAIACDSHEQDYPSGIKVTNCILWDGGNEIWNNDNSTITITYSDVQGAWPGQGNIEADPCFAEPGYWDSNGTPDDVNDDYWVDGDYHLMSEGGRWDPNGESWVLDEVTSACIDKGDWSSPIGDEPYPNGGRVNIGAYGGTGEASKSPVITCWEAGDCAGQRYGDATCDGVPSLADLFALKAHFAKSAPWTDPECCVDFNHDDSVNLADLFILRFNFGSGPYSPSTLNQNCPP
jgi:hypothetical protein